MHIDPHKSFLYPVLRQDNDDYVKGHFQGEFGLREHVSTQSVQLEVSLTLDQPDLESMLQAGTAAFAILLKCGDTYYRECLLHQHRTFQHEFPPGQLRGELEIVPFVVCMRDKQILESQDFHPEFGPSSFLVHAGNVLAHGLAHRFDLSMGVQGIGTIFEFDASPDIKDGSFSYSLDGELILIQFSLQDNTLFDDARKGSTEAQRQFMAGVYLPVIMSILNELDTDPHSHRDKRWYQVFHKVVVEKGIRPMGDGDALGRLADAQTLLHNPFGALPGMNKANLD